MDDKTPKIAVVTCSYIPEGRIEYGTPIRSIENPDYYQYYDEDKYETIKCMLACHKYYKTGINYDLFVIDNSSPDQSINDIEKYCKGNSIVFSRRENIGFSFGAFRWAFEQYKDKYDYFLFHEQDFAPCKDNWLEDFLELFNAEENTGAVGNCIEGPRGRMSQEADGVYKLYPEIPDIFINLDQLAFIKTDIMNKCIAKYGWRLIDWTPSMNDSSAATINELAFVMPLFLSGYKFKGFINEKKYIGTNGICVMDKRPWEKGIPEDKVAPMFLVHARRFHPTFKKLLSWYNE